MSTPGLCPWQWVMFGRWLFLLRISSLPAHSFLLQTSLVLSTEVSLSPSCSAQGRNFDVNTLPLLWIGVLRALSVVPWFGYLSLQVQAWIWPGRPFCGLCFAAPRIAKSGLQKSGVSLMHMSRDLALFGRWTNCLSDRLWVHLPGGMRQMLTWQVSPLCCWSERWSPLTSNSPLNPWIEGLPWTPEVCPWLQIGDARKVKRFPRYLIRTCRRH